MERKLAIVFWSIHLISYLILIVRPEPFINLFYIIVWWTFIFALRESIKAKTSEPIFSIRDLPFIILISASYWSLFELINVRIENWFYINIHEDRLIRYLGYVIAYGTVIPGIVLVREGLKAYWPLRVHGRRINFGSLSRFFMPFGLLLFLLLILFPQFLFPLAWVFPIFITEGINEKLKIRSFCYEVSSGDYTNFFFTFLSGIICGLLWEAWNFYACAKWIYTVPFFEEIKIFEMPVLGYLGFPFFALGTLSFYQLIRGLNLFRSKSFLILCLFILLLIFPQIDRRTVFSFRVQVDDLYFVPPEKRERLKEMGYKTAYSVDESLLNEGERNRLRILKLSGFGIENLRRLESFNITSIEELSRLDEEKLSRIIKEKNLRRVRFYLRKAKKFVSSSRISLSGSKRSKFFISSGLTHLNSSCSLATGRDSSSAFARIA